VSIPEDLPPVLADEVLLDAVVTNLVENVARHTTPPAPLQISARQENERIRLAIDDGGPGVPVADHERLFEKFLRLPAAVEGSRRGLGVGLAIVRGMTEAMGGTVTAGSSPIGGLRINVDLPAAPAVPTDASRATAATR
jgi:two-component system sensor histidine kinase KdpD